MGAVVHAVPAVHLRKESGRCQIILCDYTNAASKLHVPRFTCLPFMQAELRCAVETLATLMLQPMPAPAAEVQTSAKGSKASRDDVRRLNHCCAAPFCVSVAIPFDHCRT